MAAMRFSEACCCAVSFMPGSAAAASALASLSACTWWVRVRVRVRVRLRRCCVHMLPQNLTSRGGARMHARTLTHTHTHAHTHTHQPSPLRPVSFLIRCTSLSALAWSAEALLPLRFDDAAAAGASRRFLSSLPCQAQHVHETGDIGEGVEGGRERRGAV